MKNIISNKLALALMTSTLVMSGSAVHAEHHADTTQNIVEKAASMDDFSTLVAAVKAAGLVDVLSSEGPFTVFAPTNAAFEKLPAGTVESLVQPENKATLVTVLKYHVIAGNFKAADVLGLIKDAPNGIVSLTTIQGGTIKASLDAEGALILTDAKGGTSKVIIADVKQSNGTIHAIDTIVMP